MICGLQIEISFHPDDENDKPDTSEKLWNRYEIHLYDFGNSNDLESMLLGSSPDEILSEFDEKVIAEIDRRLENANWDAINSTVKSAICVTMLVDAWWEYQYNHEYGVDDYEPIINFVCFLDDLGHIAEMVKNGLPK